ncbi:class I SAM-dependent methyltransferase [Geminicoccus roseus]|uniref:class I SAM-dependent methyltransferase n=1 Tax=Geminicoccus roseus TaxID=404900 RepID=UPI00042153C4|nr:class I SAM-dependent methyltransferase [Geminicoccus roseus]
MDIETEVARHYRHGRLEESILEALAASGRAVDRLAPTDLSGADEFHLGWRPATLAFARDMELAPGRQVLDLGCGIGGPARCFAAEFGCHATGIDLSPEYVEVAASLSRRCGLAGKTAFRQASALALPFEDNSFDAVTLIHVGMNIAAKDRLFAEARRVLKRDGRFGVYDVMLTGEEPLPYPMPWAVDQGTSFVVPPATYRALLEEAGFAVEQELDRRAFALERWAEMRANVAKNGPPPLSLHTLIGPASQERLGNVMKTLEAGTIAPVQMIARPA